MSAETRATSALERVAAYESVQSAVWITRIPDAKVRAAARRVDERQAGGGTLPLEGLTFAVKDNLDVAGLPTTAGCPAFAYTPEASSPLADALIAAGAVLVGKTNLDQFATGLSGTRSAYGDLGCVFNRDYVAGGSSSGSAVAVAAGLVDFALGSDTAGSGRVPAAFNGLVGLKPTPGRWSTRGLVPACRSLDCVTVFAATVDLAARVDAVLSGFDEADPFSRETPADAPRAFPSEFRFGVPPKAQMAWFGDPESPALFDDAVKRLEAIGGRAVEIDLDPLNEAAALLYQGPWVAERTAAVERLLIEQPSAIHPVVRAILEGGLRWSAVDAFKAQYALQAHKRSAERMWREIDVLVLPTAPTIYRRREMLAEPFALNANLGHYTNFVNLLDMSALALPAGFRENQTGFGVSLIGPAFADLALIDLARRYEDAAMPDRPLLDTAGVPQTVKLAVVGAHLATMPLHWQLTSRDAKLVKRCRTALAYKLYAMANAAPPKPALVHVGEGGSAIEVEVYELEVEAFGSFVVEVPPPLAIGTVELEDGGSVKGFVAEPRALDGAEDITALGGWLAYIAREAKA